MSKRKKRTTTGGGRPQLSDAEKKRGKLLGSHIQKARNQKGWKQEDLAAKSGIRINTLKSIESGRSFAPSIFTIADLADILGKELSEWLN